MTAIRVLEADDHAIVRQGIASLVNAEPDMKLVAQTSTATMRPGEVQPGFHVDFAPIDISRLNRNWDTI